MLYPLSYEGASAQSSGLLVHPGWQGVAHVHPRRHPGQGRPTTTPRAHGPRQRPGPLTRSGTRWHRLTHGGIRSRAHTAHINRRSGVGSRVARR